MLELLLFMVYYSEKYTEVKHFSYCQKHQTVQMLLEVCIGDKTTTLCILN